MMGCIKQMCVVSCSTTGLHCSKIHTWVISICQTRNCSCRHKNLPVIDDKQIHRTYYVAMVTFCYNNPYCSVTLAIVQ